MTSSSNGRHASAEALEMVEATAAAERRRQAEARQWVPWWRWGPYLSERQWGTVREGYSPGGAAWDAFPHDHARARVYRWSEDDEFFHGDSGRGVGASHQTGWTGLVAKLLEQTATQMAALRRESSAGVHGARGVAALEGAAR